MSEQTIRALLMQKNASNATKYIHDMKIIKLKFD